MMDISIHALLAESDENTLCQIVDRCISIHALLAESDLKCPRWLIDFIIFLSTLSLRRATNPMEPFIFESIISIHALLAESDRHAKASSNVFEISIHALLAESDVQRF